MLLGRAAWRAAARARRCAAAGPAARRTHERLHDTRQQPGAGAPSRGGAPAGEAAAIACAPHPCAAHGTPHAGPAPCNTPCHPATHPPAPPPPAGQLLSHLPPRGDALGDTPDALRAAWGRDLGLSAGGMLQALVPPPITIVVDVRLVGFDGSGCAPGATPGATPTAAGRCRCICDACAGVARHSCGHGRQDPAAQLAATPFPLPRHLPPSPPL